MNKQLGIFITSMVVLGTALSAAPRQAPVVTPTTPQSSNGKTAKPPVEVKVPAGVPTPPDYVIGPEDVLLVVFWREKDMSAEVAVRPDGKISLPLINDVQAAGLSPEQLRTELVDAASKFFEEPTVTVVVKAINSRKVFVTGNVGKPAAYPLAQPTTVLQMLATAGGVLEYAKLKNIRILRVEGGKTVSFKFNYKDVMAGKNLKQNIELKPGDTIIVP